jgi:hypothetical protein
MAKDKRVFVKNGKQWEMTPFTEIKKGDKFKIVPDTIGYDINKLVTYRAVSNPVYDEQKVPWIDFEYVD